MPCWAERLRQVQHSQCRRRAIAGYIRQNFGQWNAGRRRRQKPLCRLPVTSIAPMAYRAGERTLRLILLLDEPFAALDAQSREAMQNELLRIWTATKKTSLFVTHQIDEAVLLADRVIVLGKGPGHIQEIIPIDLPRPRDERIRREPDFFKYEDRIRRLIKGNGSNPEEQ